MWERVKTFWSRVEKSPEEDGCWLWTWAKTKAGYGSYGLKGSKVYAHRFAWEITFGVIPSGRCVLHSCDVPACVRPSHLFLGTKKDNIDDMRAKGRNRDTGAPKITVEQLQFIRSIYKPKIMTARMISEQYGFPFSSVKNAVCKNHKWKGIPWPV